MMSNRQQALESWLKNKCGLTHYQITPLAGDASFRSYSRVTHQQQSYIVMDAPPERENTAPFIAIANALRKKGLLTPTIVASDVIQGFLLLTDFGDQLLLTALKQETVNALYGSALDALSILQTCDEVEGWAIPTFTAEKMRQEMEWFKQWYVVGYLKQTEHHANTLNSFFDWITSLIAEQPYVFMHRDYHSANLMVLPNASMGILDFQDAFRGPVTYDVASLLRDCYIDWPEAITHTLALSYLQRLQANHQLLTVSSDEFLFWLDCASMQRHLKALMTFSRKFLRDQNANYLQHIPRTLNYLLKISQRYAESQCLHAFLTEQVAIVCEQ